ncbi:MAG: type II secretion system protein [Polaromonas sp.]|uniref:type II secretion system protein n=1 Tax=Polaromonas sp. TaxID=1869339 RepID=UPI00248A826E|nr:type II secretion system protein [Polaromonas sp.]MDI1267733.1 type II secretion system protein [Polaromonas sp.]MDO9113390.1 type II secretion system protein [Polaromonas sp.]MDP1887484.1 type II secretion system protein [Polaromonas sp.]MDP3245953.1 type II secretion system protein [Polaromonas sp.]
MKTLKKQGGFTLVEIAIVLVIVGLLLAGVLKGQELIESSRIKNMAKDMSSMTAVVTSYQDRYRGLPGDDLTAANIADRGWTSAPALTAVAASDSLIGAAGSNPFLNTAAAILLENRQAIRALRYAGFLEGNSTDTGPLLNAAGGQIGLTNGVFGFGVRNVVCLSGLTGKQAGALDRMLDDGVSNTGDVRALVAAAPPAANAGASSPYVEATAGFVLCKPL